MHRMASSVPERPRNAFGVPLPTYGRSHAMTVWKLASEALEGRYVAALIVTVFESILKIKEDGV